MDEFVNIVDVGEMTRRKSVPVGLSFCSAAKVYQSELSQCSKPTSQTTRTLGRHTGNGFDEEVYHPSLVCG